MKTCIFDLETIANPEMTPYLPEVQADPRLKDPEKIKADVEKKKQKQVGEMGLNPETNLICTFAWMDFDDREPHSLVLDMDTLNEKDILSDIWEVLREYGQFVTFNGNAFDVEILKWHSMVHQIPISVKINQRRYQTYNHCDVRMVLTGWDNYKKGTQDYYCKLLLGEGKPEGMDGSMVQDIFDCGLIDEIRKYNEDDVIKLAQLYERLIGYYI